MEEHYLAVIVVLTVVWLLHAFTLLAHVVLWQLQKTLKFSTETCFKLCTNSEQRMQGTVYLNLKTQRVNTQTFMDL